MTTPVTKILTAVLLAASPLALPGAMSGAQAQEADRFAKVEIKAEPLAEGIAVLFGAGGNIGVSYGPDGTVLIDDQFAPLSPKIQAAIKDLGADEVKYLINTHWHGDHTGGNENFGKAGALIMAHDHVRERMLGIQETGKGNDPAAPKDALPTVTYHEGVKLHLNGDEVHVMHMKHGHTDGDSIVYWKNANIVHMGDIYFNKVTLPFIDLESGGNARGILAAAEKVLAMVDDETQIIPGHGPMATRADLMEYRDMMQTVMIAVAKAQDEGKTLEQVQAMKLAAKWDINKDAFIKGDAFIAAVYKSLNRPDHHAKSEKGETEGEDHSH